MEKVRVGIIGAGGVARYVHIRGFEAQEDAELVAICDIKEDRLQKVAEEHQIPKTFTDYQDLLKEDLDAVSVCLPNYLHSEVTVAALEAGKNVLCEKPLAINAAEGKRMVEAARRTGKKLMVGFNRRFRQEAEVLKGFIDRGELGDIYYIKASNLRRRGIPGAGGWFTTKKLSGGGVLIDIGVHNLDLALWFMGHPKPLSALGFTYQKFSHLKRVPTTFGDMDEKGAVDVEDMALGMVKFDTGATIFLEVSWAAHAGGGASEFRIYGTRAGATLSPLAIYTIQNEQLLDITPVLRGKRDHYMEEIRHFLNSIKQDKDPGPSGEDGLLVTQIIDAIYESAEKGEMVQVST